MKLVGLVLALVLALLPGLQSFAAFPLKISTCDFNLRKNFFPRFATDPAALKLFLDRQAQERTRYDAEILPLMRKNPSPYVALPKNIRPDLLSGFEAVFRMLKEPHQIFALLQDFEAFIFTVRAYLSVSSREALEEGLSALERYFGFEPAVDVQDFLPNPSMLSLIAEGHPIEDLYYAGMPHTAKAHRIEHVLAAAYLQKIFLRRYDYIQIYKEMGKQSALPSYDWSATGLESATPIVDGDPAFIDLHGYIFDTPFMGVSQARSPSDFTNPEFLSSLRRFLPILKEGWN